QHGSRRDRLRQELDETQSQKPEARNGFWLLAFVYFPVRRITPVASRTITSRPSSTGADQVADSATAYFFSAANAVAPRRTIIRSPLLVSATTCDGVSSSDACSPSRPC